jgi:type I site-specific restriction-modification system R (restriction) subunit
MLRITEDTLKNIESTTSRQLVGEVCKLIEEIEKQNLSVKESLSLIKSLVRNKIYESARNQSALIVKFSEGINFSIEFINLPRASA